jgi:phenylalanine-4-hydroxylase
MLPLPLKKFIMLQHGWSDLPLFLSALYHHQELCIANEDVTSAQVQPLELCSQAQRICFVSNRMSYIFFSSQQASTLFQVLQQDLQSNYEALP